MSLRIDKLLRGNAVVFVLSGRIQGNDLPELRGLVFSDSSPSFVVLDLSGITVVDRDSVRFLMECQKQGIEFENIPAYVLQWMGTEQD